LAPPASTAFDKALPSIIADAGGEANTIPTDHMKINTFKERVRAVVRKIPKGHVMTYGDVAYAAGAPGAARAVGTLMAGNHDKTVPCHRVVRASGHIGEYNGGGPNAKRMRLIREGVLFSGERVEKAALISRPR
jgi:methylated-DNA-[protein]-cysteine S-methyltransferase